ncbi:MAG: MFS transporter [Rhizomicrobium sp.]
MTKSGTVPLKRHVAAVVAGNALEFYDFLTYSFFAIYIGDTFFPAKDPVTSLLASLATFGAGFATRPLGGVVLGILGDRMGRKPAMYLSFTLMGLGMLGVTLTPSYAAIGVAAPVLLITFRLIQGFALGGEVGPTTAFLIEAPPPSQRGFYGSLQSASQYVATLVAGGVGTLLAALLTPSELATWGWRVAFFAGAAIIPFGLMVRRSLPETLDGSVALPTETLRENWSTVVFGLMLMAGATIATYVILSLTTYAQATLHMAAQWSFAATVAIGLGGVSGAPIGGYISDRKGRKPVMLVSNGLLLVSTIPVYFALSQLRLGVVLVLASFYLTFLLAMNAGVGIMALCELLPPKVRSGAMSTIYALAIAVFGGSAQFIVVWLTDRLHDPMAPAYYMAAALTVSFVAISALRESAPIRLTQSRPPRN